MTDWKRLKRAQERADSEYAALAYLICFIALGAALASLCV